MNKKYLFSAIFCALTCGILTACGVQVTTPTTQSTEKTTDVTTKSGANAVERTCTITEYDVCLNQIKTLNTELTKINQANQKYKNDLKVLQTQIQNNQKEQPRLNNILKTYVTKTEQKEFPFDKCGTMANFTAQDWFADFENALTQKKILFNKLGRNIITTDLTGGCYSSDGQMAFFLGAEGEAQVMLPAEENEGNESDTEKVFEFHLIKYNSGTKQVEEVLMAENLCADDVCPAVYDQRTGASIPMRGVGETEECRYNYYFEQNILVKEECASK